MITAVPIVHIVDEAASTQAVEETHYGRDKTGHKIPLKILNLTTVSLKHILLVLSPHSSQSRTRPHS